MIKKGLNPRFAEVGKIKIGGKGETRKSKTGSDYQLPIRYEHFVVTKTEKGQDGNFVIDNEIMSKLGKEPKEIPVRLLFDDIDMNFYTSFQYYHGARLVCKGDGEKADRTGQDGSTKQVQCDPVKCQYLNEEKCKVSGILSCMLAANLDIGGVHRFRTHSWNSVSNIMAALQYFSQNTNGILQGLPLKLKIIKKATAEHGNVNVVTLVLDGIELIKMREMALSEYKNRMELGIDMKVLESRAIEAGYTIDNDDPEDVATEFYPPRIEESEPQGTGADELPDKIQVARQKTAEAEIVEPESPVKTEPVSKKGTMFE